MANGTLQASPQRGIFQPRGDGETLSMSGEGHRPLAPIDPSVLGQQIVASNRIEGVSPSGEINLHLPPSGGTQPGGSVFTGAAGSVSSGAAGSVSSGAAGSVFSGVGLPRLPPEALPVKRGA